MIPNCKQTNEKEVFYWDGKSSTDNPDNIALWQEITNRCIEQKSCLVFTQLQKDTSSYKENRGIFIIDRQVLDGDYNVIDGIVETKLKPEFTSTGVTFKYLFIRATIELQGSITVTKVESVQFGDRGLSGSKFLPVESTKVTNYTPTYDYHPATKKYVDEAISNAITSALEVSY